VRILMMEGNPIEVQKKARKVGVGTASEVYTRAIQFFDTQVEIDIVNAADGEKVPRGKSFSDYAGMVISGSSLRAFESSDEVQNQIDLLVDFAKAGKPILGSCWGLQIAAIAAGGKVGPNVNGQELSVARKIHLTSEGSKHPFMQGKPIFYDAPCIHYDEVTELPKTATLLCGNKHSAVQGAIIPIENSEVWGVQYHPEFDVRQLRMLFELYKKDMMNQGFINTEEDYSFFMKHIRALEQDPDNKTAAWLLGIDQDILDGNIRGLEIKNWLQQLR
jgi:GMP synthase (glutamine-hydrolysing)